MPESSPKSRKQLAKNKRTLLSSDELPPELKEKLAELPEDAREVVLSIIMQSEVFRGPFPHPKHAAEYEKLCAGFLERSLTMAEKAQAANIENSRVALENGRLALQNQGARDRLDSRDTARGQYLGFIALMVLVAVAFVSMLRGHEKIAMIFFGAGVLGVIGKFLAGKFSAAGHEAKD